MCATRCSARYCSNTANVDLITQASLDMALIEVCAHSTQLGGDHLPCMLRLLDAGADPLANFNGVTPLVQREHDEDAHMLLEIYAES